MEPRDWRSGVNEFGRHVEPNWLTHILGFASPDDEIADEPAKSQTFPQGAPIEPEWLVLFPALYTPESEDGTILEVRDLETDEEGCSNDGSYEPLVSGDESYELYSESDDEWHDLDIDYEDGTESYSELEYGFRIVEPYDQRIEDGEEWDDEQCDQAWAQRAFDDEVGCGGGSADHEDGSDVFPDPVGWIIFDHESEHGRGPLTANELLPDEELNRRRDPIHIYIVVERLENSNHPVYGTDPTIANRIVFLSLDDAYAYCLDEAQSVYVTPQGPVFNLLDGSFSLEVEVHRLSTATVLSRIG